jgi:hypothetical protein
MNPRTPGPAGFWVRLEGSVNLRATPTAVGLSLAAAILVHPGSGNLGGTSGAAPASPAELAGLAPDTGLRSGLLGSQPGAAFVSLAASVPHVSARALRKEPVGPVGASVGFALLAAAATYTSVRRRRRATVAPRPTGPKIRAEDLASAFRRADRGALGEGLAAAEDVLSEVGPLSAWPAPSTASARRTAWRVAQVGRASGASHRAAGEPSPPARSSRGDSGLPPQDLDLEAQTRLCAALFSQGRFQEVAALAREALGQHPGNDRLLLHLSRATSQLGREDEALDWALRAVRSQRSRAAVGHLMRLLALTRRFEPADHERLRLALDRHPEAPLLLHAAGVAESMYGCRRTAHRLLLAALQQETDAEMQREIARVLAGLEEPAGLPAAPPNPS